MPDSEHDRDRPVPEQDRDTSRLDRARARREADGETSLGDEAVAHAQSMPDHREPGATGEEARTGRGTPTGAEIVHDSADAAGSAAQVGKPLVPRGGR
ncbi:hypothetical protein [Salinarimonas rosea]|uniref:hypothetical protein n=1 Tax=Salinarimonas rosea TaxID=552063 RepID=UPI000405DFEA|nr:hypothetical protein [Salinarimonas rosea]